MTKLLEDALKSITARTNISTGLSHPNDMNAAKEMFVLLHQEGEKLDSIEIQTWAIQNNWQYDYAKELGALADRIGKGSQVRIKNGPWWKKDIISILKNEMPNNALHADANSGQRHTTPRLRRTGEFNV